MRATRTHAKPYNTDCGFLQGMLCGTSCSWCLTCQEDVEGCRAQLSFVIGVSYGSRRTCILAELVTIKFMLRMQLCTLDGRGISSFVRWCYASVCRWILSPRGC